MPNWKKVAVSGSAASFSSLHVDNSVTASIFSGSEFIGNLSGTSSYALTASYVLTAPTIVTGSNATFVQSTPANTWVFVHNLNDQFPVFQVFNASNEVIIPASITANNTTSATIYFNVPTAGTAVASIGGYTGSTTTPSASFASTASYAFTASYALNVPETSSFAVSASHATNADQAISSSYSLTASYALNVPQTASNADTASYAFYAVTASYALDAELLDGLDSTSFTSTSSFNSFTSSVEANYATKTELNTSASALQAGVTSSISVAVSDLQAGVTASIAGFATTGSNTFTGTNNFNVVSASYIQALSASIDYLSVIYQTSSVVYSSGSNIFGDNANDTQTLWGTVDIVTGPLNVTGSVNSSGGFTGSLLGTATSASYASNSSNSITASYVEVAQTASYVLNAQTASYVENAQSASYVANAISSSFALTASYALNAEGGGGATTGSNTFYGDQTISGSLAATGSITANVFLTPTTASSVIVPTGFNGLLVSPVQLQGSSSVAIGSKLTIL